MLNDTINIHLMDAMKNKDSVGTQVCKLIKAEFLKAEKEKGFTEWSEASELKILQKMVCQREDSIKQYTNAKRTDLANAEQKELDFLLNFVPKQPSDTEISSYTQLVINEMKTNGEVISMKVMKTILSKVQEKFPTANGKIVSQVVKENVN